MQSVETLAPNAQHNAAQMVLHPAQLESEEEMPPSEAPLPLEQSLQIRAAEYWLKLGEADQALRELEALPSRIWKCGWALKTRIAAIGVLRQRREVTVQK